MKNKLNHIPRYIMKRLFCKLRQNFFYTIRNLAINCRVEQSITTNRITSRHTIQYELYMKTLQISDNSNFEVLSLIFAAIWLSLYCVNLQAYFYPYIKASYSNNTHIFRCLHLCSSYNYHQNPETLIHLK